jgi:hypothetical protein
VVENGVYLDIMLLDETCFIRRCLQVVYTNSDLCGVHLRMDCEGPHGQIVSSFLFPFFLMDHASHLVLGSASS